VTSSPEHEEQSTGLAHVAAVSFLAARAAPSIGFFVALTGGASLARASERDGLRWGYGASLAAMLQTIAIMGPARVAVPLTQALSAPLVGWLDKRGTAIGVQMLVCSVIRLIHNATTLAFFIFVLSGGFDTYTGTYDSIAKRLPLPEGSQAALIATGIALVSWTVFASVVQVLAYRRAGNRWAQPESLPAAAEPTAGEEPRRTYDPRAIAVAAAIAFGLLIASTAWPLLAAVTGFLLVASVTSRGDTSVAGAGLALAAILGGLVLVFTFISGIGLEAAAQRGARAGLLVAVATWLRAAAGTPGLREVSRRALRRLRGLPAVPQAARVLDRLDTGRQMLGSASAALSTLGDAPMRPVPLLDASVRWAEREAAQFVPLPPAKPAILRARLRDLALVGLSVAPVATLLA